MSSKKKQKDPILKEKLNTLKQKQDKWLKERSQSLTKPLSKSSPGKAFSSTPKRSPSSPIKSNQDTLLWNTSSNKSYSGFVIRKPSSGSKSTSSGSNTDRSVLNHSSLRPQSDSKCENKYINLSDSTTPTKGGQVPKTDDWNKKMDEYLSKLDIEEEATDYSEYEESHSISSSDSYGLKSNNQNSTSKDKENSIMKTHICSICTDLMSSDEKSPQTIYPCGHTFCLNCLVGQKYCQTCHCAIDSLEVNYTLMKVINQFQERQKEAEIKKYVDEYESLKSRTLVMKEEASTIIDKMENVTHELLERKSRVQLIEGDAVEIKNQMKAIQEQLRSLEDQHSSENNIIFNLEDEYKSCKKQLLIIEKTLKTLMHSRERVKFMVENIAPSVGLDDQQLSD